MKVGELIEVLDQFDPFLEAVVVLPDGETLDVSDIEQEGGYVMIEGEWT